MSALNKSLGVDHWFSTWMHNGVVWSYSLKLSVYGPDPKPVKSNTECGNQAFCLFVCFPPPPPSSPGDYNVKLGLWNLSLDFLKNKILKKKKFTPYCFHYHIHIFIQTKYSFLWLVHILFPICISYLYK